MKRNSKKGFTLAELLIVIAIIAILVAIMLPVFAAQLNKARAAAELSNVRAAYSELVANAMLGDSTDLTAGPTNTDSDGKLQIESTDLEEAKQYDETEVTVAGTTVTVTYKGYSGTFEVDEDVVFIS